MSKKSKAKAKRKRRDKKRARKATQQALYDSYKKQGINTKSKRARKSAKNKGPKATNHLDGRCGNIGCIKCHGVHMKPYLRKGKPNRMPSWMYKLWSRWGDTIKGDMLLRNEKLAKFEIITRGS